MTDIGAEVGGHQGEPPRDWARVLREGEIKTGQDLYQLVKDVWSEQNEKNPKGPPPPGVSEEYWDPTAVDLKWKGANIDLAHYKQDRDEPYDHFDINLDEGKRGDWEYLQLRKYADGKVRAFLDRSFAHSAILKEDFGDQWEEVLLTPKRAKRIAQVIVFAHARTMAEAQEVS